MGTKWTEEQKAAASERMTERNAAKKAAQTTEAIRVPIGAKRELLNVTDTPDGYVDRIVNDNPGRIDTFKRAGYEIVESATIGSSNVDGKSANAGVVSKDVGKGVNAFVMRQRKDHYDEDQAMKQQQILDDERGMQKKVDKNDSKDGIHGEFKIG